MARALDGLGAAHLIVNCTVGSESACLLALQETHAKFAQIPDAYIVVDLETTPPVLPAIGNIIRFLGDVGTTFGRLWIGFKTPTSQATTQDGFVGYGKMFFAFLGEYIALVDAGTKLPIGLVASNGCSYVGSPAGPPDMYSACSLPSLDCRYWDMRTVANTQTLPFNCGVPQGDTTRAQSTQETQGSQSLCSNVGNEIIKTNNLTVVWTAPEPEGFAPNWVLPLGSETDPGYLVLAGQQSGSLAGCDVPVVVLASCLTCPSANTCAIEAACTAALPNLRAESLRVAAVATVVPGKTAAAGQDMARALLDVLHANRDMAPGLVLLDLGSPSWAGTVVENVAFVGGLLDVLYSVGTVPRTPVPLPIGYVLRRKVCTEDLLGLDIPSRCEGTYGSAACSLPWLWDGPADDPVHVIPYFPPGGIDGFCGFTTPSGLLYDISGTEGGKCGLSATNLVRRVAVPEAWASLWTAEWPLERAVQLAAGTTYTADLGCAVDMLSADTVVVTCNVSVAGCAAWLTEHLDFEAERRIDVRVLVDPDMDAVDVATDLVASLVPNPDSLLASGALPFRRLWVSFGTVNINNVGFRSWAAGLFDALGTLTTPLPLGVVIDTRRCLDETDGAFHGLPLARFCGTAAAGGACALWHEGDGTPSGTSGALCGFAGTGVSVQTDTGAALDLTGACNGVSLASADVVGTTYLSMARWLRGRRASFVSPTIGLSIPTSAQAYASGRLKDEDPVIAMQGRPARYHADMDGLIDPFGYEEGDKYLLAANTDYLYPTLNCPSFTRPNPFDDSAFPPQCFRGQGDSRMQVYVAAYLGLDTFWAQHTAFSNFAGQQPVYINLSYGVKGVNTNDNRSTEHFRITFPAGLTSYFVTLVNDNHPYRNAFRHAVGVRSVGDLYSVSGGVPGGNGLAKWDGAYFTASERSQDISAWARPLQFFLTMYTDGQVSATLTSPGGAETVLTLDHGFFDTAELYLYEADTAPVPGTVLTVAVTRASSSAAGYLVANLVVNSQRRILRAGDWSADGWRVRAVSPDERPGVFQGPARQSPAVWAGSRTRTDTVRFRHVLGAGPSGPRTEASYSGRMVVHCRDSATVEVVRGSTATQVYVDLRKECLTDTQGNTVLKCAEYHPGFYQSSQFTRLPAELFEVMPGDTVRVNCTWELANIQQPLTSNPFSVDAFFNAELGIQEFVTTAKTNTAWTGTNPADLSQQWNTTTGTITRATSLLYALEPIGTGYAQNQGPWEGQWVGPTARGVPANQGLRTFEHTVPFVTRASAVYIPNCIECAGSACGDASGTSCTALRKAALEVGYRVLLGVVVDFSAGDDSAVQAQSAALRAFVGDEEVVLVLNIGGSTWGTGQAMNSALLRTLFSSFAADHSPTSGVLDSSVLMVRAVAGDCASSGTFGAAFNMGAVADDFAKLLVGLLWEDTSGSVYVLAGEYPPSAGPVCGFARGSVYGRVFESGPSTVAWAGSKSVTRVHLRGPPTKRGARSVGYSGMLYGVALRSGAEPSAEDVGCLVGETVDSLQSALVVFDCDLGATCGKQLDALNGTAQASHPIVTLEPRTWAEAVATTDQLLALLYNLADAAASRRMGRLWFRLVATDLGPEDAVAWLEQQLVLVRDTVGSSDFPIGLVLATTECAAGAFYGGRDLFGTFSMVSSDVLLWAPDLTAVTAVSHCGFAGSRIVTLDGQQPARAVDLSGYLDCLGVDADTLLNDTHLTAGPVFAGLGSSDAVRVEPVQTAETPWPTSRGVLVAGAGPPSPAMPGCLAALRASAWIVDCELSESVAASDCRAVISALSSNTAPAAPRLFVRWRVGMAGTSAAEQLFSLLGIILDLANPADSPSFAQLWLRLDSGELATLDPADVVDFVTSILEQLASVSALPVGFSIDATQCNDAASGLHGVDLKSVCEASGLSVCTLWHVGTALPVGNVCGYTEVALLDSPVSLASLRSPLSECSTLDASLFSGDAYVTGRPGAPLATQAVRVTYDPGVTGAVALPSQLGEVDLSACDTQAGYAFLVSECIVCSGTECTVAGECRALLETVSVLGSDAGGANVRVSIGVVPDPGGALGAQGESLRQHLGNLSNTGLVWEHLVVELVGASPLTWPGTGANASADNFGEVTAFLSGLLPPITFGYNRGPFRIGFQVSVGLCAAGGALAGQDLRTLCQTRYSVCEAALVWYAPADETDPSPLLLPPAMCGFLPVHIAGKIFGPPDVADQTPAPCGIARAGAVQTRAPLGQEHLSWPVPRSVYVSSSLEFDNNVMGCLTFGMSGLASYSLLHGCELDAKCRAVLEVYGPLWPSQPVVSTTVEEGQLTVDSGDILGFLGDLPVLRFGRLWVSVSVASGVSGAKAGALLGDLFLSLKRAAYGQLSLGVRVSQTDCAAGGVLADVNVSELCRIADTGCAGWVSGNATAFSTPVCGFEAGDIALRPTGEEVSFTGAATCGQLSGIEVGDLVEAPRYVYTEPRFATPYVHFARSAQPQQLGYTMRGELISSLDTAGCRRTPGIVAAGCMACSGESCSWVRECLETVRGAPLKGLMPTVTLVVDGSLSAGELQAQGRSARALLEAEGPRLHLARFALDLEGRSGWSGTASENVAKLAGLLSGLVGPLEELQVPVPLSLVLSAETCRARFGGADLVLMCYDNVSQACELDLVWAAYRDGHTQRIMGDLGDMCGFTAFHVVVKEWGESEDTACGVAGARAASFTGSGFPAQLTSWPVPEEIVPYVSPTYDDDEGDAAMLVGHGWACFAVLLVAVLSMLW